MMDHFAPRPFLTVGSPSVFTLSHNTDISDLEKLGSCPVPLEAAKDVRPANIAGDVVGSGSSAPGL